MYLSWWICKQTMAQSYNEIHLTVKKWIIYKCNNMDKYPIHYVQSKAPDSQSYTLNYSFFFFFNILERQNYRDKEQISNFQGLAVVRVTTNGQHKEIFCRDSTLDCGGGLTLGYMILCIYQMGCQNPLKCTTK